MLRLSTNDEHCDARNNIFYSTLPGSDLAFLDSSGVLDLTHNWVKPGWITSFSAFSGTLNDDGTMVEGSDAGFVNEAAQEFQLAASSANIDAASNLNPAVLPAHNVVNQYVKHQAAEGRPSDALFDIDAYEFLSGGNQSPIAVASATPIAGPVPLLVNFDGTGSSDPGGAIVSYA